MTGQEYPCRLCNEKCPNLYGVKLHILECHEDYVGEQEVKTENQNVKHELKTKKKLFKRKFKRITHSKKPWCNYCWIKFKNVKEYREHREICPNKPSLTNPLNQTATLKSVRTNNEMESFSQNKSPIKIETKVDEGKEITDLHPSEPSLHENPVQKTSRLNMAKSGSVEAWLESLGSVERIHDDEEEQMECLLPLLKIGHRFWRLKIKKI